MYDVEGRPDVDGKSGKVKAMGLDLRPDISVFAKLLSEVLMMVLLEKPQEEVLNV